ncbi:AMP-binding protein [Methylonatrum kenyense]|uniref:class I adenylate-forming enzyme family protein n=1 Tax=Methylonatrum kenyense TaxID=455253 RepID=UPI0020BE7DF4|nr:AMP-binding protein [Methylonatrum kenyense]MCK8516435.1 AMP-binding protein [Methylonatrum kenyense]
MTRVQPMETQPMDWIGNWVGRWARVAPDRAALYDDLRGTTFSYAELNARANALAHWLTRVRGLRKGDRIALMLHNRVEAVDFYLACGKVGIILAPLSYRLRPRELNALLHRIRPRLLVSEDTFDNLAAALEQPESLEYRLEIVDHGESYDAEMLQTGRGSEANCPLAMTDVFLYIHTGGTTSTPKVCIVPYRQMIWNALELIVAGGGTMDARELVTFPLFHVGGWNSLTPILHGGGFSVLMGQFDPERLLDLVDQQRIRHFGAVEAMLSLIAAAPSFADTSLATLEAITTAGAPCAREVMAPFVERGIAVRQAYGLTEAGPSNFIHAPPDATATNLRHAQHSIGTAMPHGDYRIVDPETMSDVPRGEAGVLCLRSMHSFAGYLGDPERTRAALLADGWVFSGDLALEEADGLVRIIGRADNMFISGGENVSPEEIEQVMEVLPVVRQAAVVAAPDSRWGEVPIAAVVIGDGVDPAEAEVTILGHCREQLAAFKVPKRVHFLQQLPLTGAGKLDRRSLEEKLR